MTKINCCDDVFDALTAGPLLVGSGTADAVERHLADCESCRDLAHALRPARHLLHESLPDDQQDNLPQFLTQQDMVEGVMARVNEVHPHVGSPLSRSATLSRSAASSRSATPSRSATSSRSATPSFLLGMFVAGMLLLLLFANPWNGSQASLARGPSELDGWNLPPACRTIALDQSVQPVGWWGPLNEDLSPGTESDRDTAMPSLDPGAGDVTAVPDSAAADAGDYHCCTICHHAVNGTERQMVDPTTLVAACNACH